MMIFVMLYIVHVYYIWCISVLAGNKADPSKHVLLMDEVDGMAGNEDRGGMQVRSSYVGDAVA